MGYIAFMRVTPRRCGKRWPNSRQPATAETRPQTPDHFNGPLLSQLELSKPTEKWITAEDGTRVHLGDAASWQDIPVPQPVSGVSRLTAAHTRSTVHPPAVPGAGRRRPGRRAGGAPSWSSIPRSISRIGIMGSSYGECMTN